VSPGRGDLIKRGCCSKTAMPGPRLRSAAMRPELRCANRLQGCQRPQNIGESCHSVSTAVVWSGRRLRHAPSRGRPSPNARDRSPPGRLAADRNRGPGIAVALVVAYFHSCRGLDAVPQRRPHIRSSRRLGEFDPARQQDPIGPQSQSTPRPLEAAATWRSEQSVPRQRVPAWLPVTPTRERP